MSNERRIAWARVNRALDIYGDGSEYRSAWDAWAALAYSERMQTVAGETLTSGAAILVGPCLCGGDLWLVPWYVVTMRGARHHMDIRVCDVCEQQA